MKNLTLSGHSEFKGRNGYARLARVTSHQIPTLGQNEPALRLSIGLWSKRAADNSSALIELTGEDAHALKAWFADLAIPEFPHAPVGAGHCDVCGHYGDDCTGKLVAA
jgi:hypothetical protein